MIIFIGQRPRQGRFKDFLVNVLEEESRKIGYSAIEKGIEDDHIHLVIALRPILSVSEVFHQLKGKGSYEIFTRFIHL